MAPRLMSYFGLIPLISNSNFPYLLNNLPRFWIPMIINVLCRLTRGFPLCSGSKINSWNSSSVMLILWSTLCVRKSTSWGDNWPSIKHNVRAKAVIGRHQLCIFKNIFSGQARKRPNSPPKIIIQEYLISTFLHPLLIQVRLVNDSIEQILIGVWGRRMEESSLRTICSKDSPTQDRSLSVSL